MEYLILCTFLFAFGILALAIYLCFILLKKKSQNWEENKKLGQAEITMWAVEKLPYYYPCGRIIGIPNQTAYSIHDRNGKGYMSYKYKEKYPVGSIIDVEYAEYKYMGCETFIDIRYVGKE